MQLSLLEIPDAVKAAEGTAMELDDCAFPLLQDMVLAAVNEGLRSAQELAANKMGGLTGGLDLGGLGLPGI